MITVIIREKRFECHAALRSLFISLLRSLPLVLEKKNSFYNFLLRSLRHGRVKKTKFHFSTTFTTPWSWKKLFTLSFIKNTLIATTSTTPRSWQRNIYFHFSITTFTTPWWWKKKLFPLLLTATTFTTPWSWQKYMFSFQQYVYYTLIMTKNILFFISVLRSLGPNHEKKKNFPIATTFTTFAIMTKTFLFFATTFTTPWLALRPLRPD